MREEKGREKNKKLPLRVFWQIRPGRAEQGMATELGEVHVCWSPVSCFFADFFFVLHLHTTLFWVVAVRGRCPALLRWEIFTSATLVLYMGVLGPIWQTTDGAGRAGDQ